MNPIIPKTNSAPGAGAPASLYLGELASNRTTGKLYLGCDSGVVEIQGGGGGGTAGSQISTFTGTGSQTAFAPLTGYSNTTVGNYLVSVGGIDQRPTEDWTISSANSGTITFASAPPNGAPIVVRAFVGASGGGGGSGDATSLQGRALADTAPTDGQAVVWDDANGTWKPNNVLNNLATGFRGIAVNSESASSYALLIGHYNICGEQAVSIGNACEASAYSIAIGTQALTGSSSIAIGNGISALGQNAIAIGNNISAANFEIKIGNYNHLDVLLGAYNIKSINTNVSNCVSKINEIITWANTAGANITPLYAE